MKMQYVVLLLGLSATVFAAPVDRDRMGVRWGWSPISNYTSDLGLMFGAFTQRFDYGDGERTPYEGLVTLQSRYATKGPRDLYFASERTGIGPWFGMGDLRLSTEVYGQQNRFQRFYGMGEATPYSKEAEQHNYYYFYDQSLSITQTVRKNTAAGFEWLTGFSLTKSWVRPNSQDTLYGESFGLEPQTSFYPKVYLGAVWEGRDYEIVPSTGHYASVLGTVSSESWARFDIDVRRYDPLLEGRWLWLATQMRMAHAEGDAPLMEKPRLGSIGTLRGLPINRYLANSSMSLRSELRSVWLRDRFFDMPLKMGTGVFVDSGKAFDSWDRMLPSPWRWAYGLSFFGSYFTDDFLGTADIGFSKEGTALYLKLGHAF